MLVQYITIYPLYRLFQSIPICPLTSEHTVKNLHLTLPNWKSTGPLQNTSQAFNFS